MKIKVNNLNIDYIDLGKINHTTLVFLHGWANGYNKELYSSLINKLSKKFHIIAPDFPGFGNSDLPKKPWNLNDFSEFTKSFCQKLKIKKCILIGHSFGGKVVLKLACQNPKFVQKIILIDSAGIEKKSPRVKTIIKITNMVPEPLKPIILPPFGSTDYNDSLGIMRKSFKKIINENLEKTISAIKIPTLLIWGKNDQLTPLWQGEIMNKKIKNSKLVIVPNNNHDLVLDKPTETVRIIKQFLSP